MLYENLSLAYHDNKGAGWCPFSANSSSWNFLFNLTIKLKKIIFQKFTYQPFRFNLRFIQ